jgi:hypothetical protein
MDLAVFLNGIKGDGMYGEWQGGCGVLDSGSWKGERMEKYVGIDMESIMKHDKNSELSFK